MSENNHVKVLWSEELKPIGLNGNAGDVVIFARFGESEYIKTNLDSDFVSYYEIPLVITKVDTSSDDKIYHLNSNSEIHMDEINLDGYNLYYLSEWWRIKEDLINKRITELLNDVNKYKEEERIRNKRI